MAAGCGELRAERSFASDHQQGVAGGEHRSKALAPGDQTVELEEFEHIGVGAEDVVEQHPQFTLGLHLETHGQRSRLFVMQAANICS